MVDREAIITIRGTQRSSFRSSKVENTSVFRQLTFEDAGWARRSLEDKRPKIREVLNEFYDEVVAMVRGADTIQIFGPGEAKGELEKRLERAGLKERVLAIEAADKMTDRQIAAKVRKRFQR
jgi:hypothetical protein